MYSPESQADLIKQTQELIQNPEDLVNNSEADTIEVLRTLINFHDWRYYVQSEAVIADYEYDMMYKRLRALEEANPELITADSPTQRVAAGLNDDFATVAHSIPMLSLDNSYNADDLNDFDRRVRELSEAEKIEYTVEPKFDGGSIALLYVDDVLVRAATRGNGVEGDEITQNAKALKSIPLKADFSSLGLKTVEVRGEVIIEQGFFNKMNEERAARDEKTFQNARNTASGALRLKDPAEVARRGLEAFIYQIGYAVDADGNNLLGSAVATHNESIELLAKLGFKTPVNEKKLCKTIEEVVAFSNDWEAKRDTYSYEIDGMVIKVNDYTVQEKIGATAHHPRWAIAYKFKAKQATTKLERIEYQVGRTGAVTPVAKLSPVPLAGVTISSVSLHNEEFIAEKDIRIGDTVIVERAGDVIPYIVGSVKEARTGNEEILEFPKNCPRCEQELFKIEEEAVWRCVNVICPAQTEERLIHFVSKGAMNIDGLGKDIIKRLKQEEILADIPGIYNIDYEKVLALEGWKEKSVENLRNGIEASKKQPLWRLITGLGLRHIGGTTAKLLAKQVEELTDFVSWDKEQLIELEDVGPKVADSIFDFFHTPSNIEIIDKLRSLGVNTRNEGGNGSGGGAGGAAQILEGKTFLFTGTLPTLGRDEARELVEQHGGKNISGVSKNLNYLVAGEKAGSKLKKAQDIGTIEIISEADFLEMINK